MGNDKKTGCLGYVGDDTTQLCGDDNHETITRIPIKQPVSWKVGGFVRGSNGKYAIHCSWDVRQLHHPLVLSMVVHPNTLSFPQTAAEIGVI